MNNETYTPCTKCGRPMAYCKGQCCGKTKGCHCQEYGPKVCGAIRPGEPKCPYQAVIPSLTVESVSNLKDLADCFVHVSDINTTFYIDDKHRIMTTWAGPVEYNNYDLEANTLGLRSQFLIDFANEQGAYYDKTGAYQIFKFGEGGADEPIVLTMSYPESGSDWDEVEINGAAMSGAYASSARVDVATFTASDESISFTNETTLEQLSISDVYEMLESGAKVIINNAPIGIVVENDGEAPALVNTVDGVELKKQQLRVSASTSINLYTGTAFLMVDGTDSGSNATVLGMAIGPESSFFVQGIRKNILS